MTDKEIVFFDGVCNLCNGSVQTILKYDRKKRFHFASLQSLTARELLPEKYTKEDELGTIVFMQKNGSFKTKSTAVLNIAKYLSFPLNLTFVFILVPVFIRNWVYDRVAKNRYKWFGKQDTCWLPTPELKSRFLP